MISFIRGCLFHSQHNRLNHFKGTELYKQDTFIHYFIEYPLHICFSWVIVFKKKKTFPQ